MKQKSRYHVLRKMGLIETLCFTETNDRGWWFVKDGVVTFMLISVKRTYAPNTTDMKSLGG